MWAIVERPLCSAYLLEIADTVTAKVEQIRQLLKSIETGDPKPVLVVNEAKYFNTIRKPMRAARVWRHSLHGWQRLSLGLK